MFSYILVLMFSSHNLRRNAEGTRITLMYKVLFQNIMSENVTFWLARLRG